MTTLKKSLLSAVVGVASAAGAPAQSLGLPVTGSNSTSVGGDSSTASASGSGSSPQQNPAFAAPVITGLDPTAGLTSGYLQPSNILGGYYANPFYAGRAGAALDTRPGGFGDALFPATGGTANRGRSSNAFSAASGSNGVTGFGSNSALTGSTTGRGLGGNQAFGQNRGNQGFGGNQAFGVVIPAPGPISYTATLRFAVPAPTAPQVAADLRGVLDRSSMLTNSRSIDLFTNGSKVVLRGTVPSAQESETAEGMVRLTPGVFEVVNELQVVAPAAPAVPPTPAP